ncbi:retrovirus-related pol polyprotein from transposon TNT 1-94 [Tanacetum coccineum]
MKDVRYIPSLKRRLISVGQLDEEGYHVDFGDQQWKVTKGSLVVAHGNKRGSLYMVRWFGEAEEGFLQNVRKDKETIEVFGCDSFVKVKDICKEAMKCTFIGSGSDEMRYSFWDMKSHQVIRSRDITFVDSIYKAWSATNSSILTKPIQKSHVVLVDIPENLAENDNIVAEHGLSSKITQNPCGSSDTSEGSENSKSFKDSGRLDEEDSKDEAFSEEGGSETPQVRRSTRESRALVRYSLSTNYLLLTENGESESYSEA